MCIISICHQFWIIGALLVTKRPIQHSFHLCSCRIWAQTPYTVFSTSEPPVCKDAMRAPSLMRLEEQEYSITSSCSLKRSEIVLCYSIFLTQKYVTNPLTHTSSVPSPQLTKFTPAYIRHLIIWRCQLRYTATQQKAESVCFHRFSSLCLTV